MDSKEQFFHWVQQRTALEGKYLDQIAEFYQKKADPATTELEIDTFTSALLALHEEIKQAAANVEMYDAQVRKQRQARRLLQMQAQLEREEKEKSEEKKNSNGQ